MLCLARETGEETVAVRGVDEKKAKKIKKTS